jgi:hypothetical protein
MRPKLALDLSYDEARELALSLEATHDKIARILPLYIGIDILDNTLKDDLSAIFSGQSALEIIASAAQAFRGAINLAAAHNGNGSRQTVLAIDTRG